mgnify:CR=1 FL=1
MGLLYHVAKGALCRSGMIQCSLKHTESLIRIVYRGVIISCRKRRAVPKRYDSMFPKTHRISDLDCVSWGYYIMSQRRAVPKRYDSMFSETHQISDMDCVSWGYYIMSQRRAVAKRYDSMLSETHRISDMDCVSWGYYIMSQKARCAEVV